MIHIVMMPSLCNKHAVYVHSYIYSYIHSFTLLQLILCQCEPYIVKNDVFVCTNSSLDIVDDLYANGITSHSMIHEIRGCLHF